MRGAWLELAELLSPLLKSDTALQWDAVQRRCREHPVLQSLLPAPAICIPEVWLRFLTGALGTGEQVFRNLRSSIGGFATRHLHLEVITGNTDDDLQKDSRFLWLVDFVRSNPGEKLLCICAARKMVRAIQSALQKTIRVDFCVFHEDMSLVARDRAAAWFADPDGAVLLVASEIGSEGRNFQFARHVLLFDLPRKPGLLEQRIGRLDRIGQGSDIHIHVPCPERSAWKAAYLEYLAEEKLQPHLRAKPGLPAQGSAALSEDVLQRLECTELRLEAIAVLIAP